MKELRNLNLMGEYLPIFIKFFYESSPDDNRIVGTRDCPVYLLGYYKIKEDGSLDYILSHFNYIFDGKIVNIYTETFGLFRKIKFSKTFKLE